jgi:D-alanine-D-alanine ligase
MRKLRVLALMHSYLVPPEDTTGIDLATVKWKTEHDVLSTLRELGHDVMTLGVSNDLGVVRNAASEWQPQIAFNLLEGFDEIGVFDQNVVSYLELLRLSYTGCNPRGLLLSRDKSLSKQLLAYHRIPVPDFVVVPRGRRARKPKRLSFPLFVKSLTEDASIGIAQASVVETEDRLVERVDFIHRSIGTDAIVEQYIEGRELYVGVMGNDRLRVFPVWELDLTKMPEDARKIATGRVKWSAKYQQKHSINTHVARNLSDSLAARIQHLGKRVYRALQISGYARIDFRLDEHEKIYVLEANPNPQIAYGEDFAESAEHAGISYEGLLQRILNIGLEWQPERTG